jgi:hypothetical protein
VHVTAAAEVAFRAGDHHRPDVRNVLEEEKRVRELTIRFERERIFSLGSVQRDRGNPVSEFPLEVLRIDR